MRRIVFSIAFFRQKLPVQLVSASTKSRRKILHASSMLEFSHSLDPERTSVAYAKGVNSEM